ncbi:glycosyltransferase [Salicibibacter cibi]|uniref:Glycosyltransferase n=1 Tax=Salicibibacter cibi TaxID=2743001 RepID=A0A7T7CFU7_9BACI|nr:glycosyltransferase [Salicibibacter cibi]QQK80448.1 glycosyltransferase [Salicibibacter cibi]
MNILVLTSVYPQPDDPNNSGVTPVVHYFAKEWVKQGHNVLVVHNSNKYPSFVYLLSERFKGTINSKVGGFIPNKNIGVLDYQIDGVKVLRLPITKKVPRKPFSSKQINHQYNKIKSYLKEKNFKPDFVTGHWENPQIPLLSMFKEDYSCKTSIVLHELHYIKKSNRWLNTLSRDIDTVGCRSVSMSQKLLNIVDTKDPFICYSGLPNEFIEHAGYNKVPKKIFNETPLKNFVYVGRLILRKNIDVIIKSLNDVYPNKDFKLHIVGEGPEESNLKSLVADLNLDHNIDFKGKLSRPEIMDLLRSSQGFIMVSEREAFGLVYLEAMLANCIVIGSKNEGIDGVINNNENGFLCKSNSVENLVETLNYINKLDEETKERIANTALEAALKFSDSKVAEHYLRNAVKS